MPLLTTIVPVYNVERYVPTCLESLLRQGLNEGEHEVLLIDDGSTDSSGRICDDYADRYPGLFRVIHKPNSGVSATRNLGIREAGGEYIHFLDADDFMDYGSYRIFIDLAFRHNVDYLGFHMSKCIDVRFYDAVPPQGYVQLPKGEVIVFEGCGLDMIKDNRVITFCTRCIMKRGFILKNNLSFNEEIAIVEDGDFIFRMMALSPRVILTNLRAYNSVIRFDSAVTSDSADRVEKWINGIMNMVATVNDVAARYPALIYGATKYKSVHVAQLVPKLLRFKLNKKGCRDLIKRLHELNAIPVDGDGFYYSAVNFLLRHPGLMPFSSVLYRKVFYPFIYPLFVKFVLKQ